MAHLIPELKVSNFNKSLDFYIRLAEFKVKYSRPESNFAMLEIGDSSLMIESIVEQNRWSVGLEEKPFGRGIHLQIEVPDVHYLYKKFKQATYPICFEMEEKWYRVDDREVGHHQFLVQDPDGYLLRFFEKIGTRTL